MRDIATPGISTYWEDPSNVETVGDFGPDEPMFHEIWGAAWVKSTLAVNVAAAPIPSEDNRQPHLVGPRLLVTNPQNGRVQALDFPARSHGPAKVTTWFKGSDPWDVVGPWNGSYFVSERGAHRVLQLDEKESSSVCCCRVGLCLALNTLGSSPGSPR